MKVRVKYKQECSLGVYRLFRIIELKPDNLIFKQRVKTEVYNMLCKSKEEYVRGVREILNYSKAKLKREVKKVIIEECFGMEGISREIKDYNIELDIDLN